MFWSSVLFCCFGFLFKDGYFYEQSLIELNSKSEAEYNEDLHILMPVLTCYSL